MSDNPIEDFVCELSKIEPLSTWVDREDPHSCHPCLISPLASYYLGVLEEASDHKHANLLKSAYEANSESKILTIAQTMDKIKLEVGDDLKKKLVALDCFAQSYKDTAES